MPSRSHPPIGIQEHIGRRPIAAFGNSDGDEQMLEWTGAGKGTRLMMLVHHDDAGARVRLWGAVELNSNRRRLPLRPGFTRSHNWVDSPLEWTDVQVERATAESCN